MAASSPRRGGMKPRRIRTGLEAGFRGRRRTQRRGRSKPIPLTMCPTLPQTRPTQPHFVLHSLRPRGQDEISTRAARAIAATFRIRPVRLGDKDRFTGRIRPFRRAPNLKTWDSGLGAGGWGKCDFRFPVQGESEIYSCPSLVPPMNEAGKCRGTTEGADATSPISTVSKA